MAVSPLESVHGAYFISCNMQAVPHGAAGRVTSATIKIGTSAGKLPGEDNAAEENLQMHIPAEGLRCISVLLWRRLICRELLPAKSPLPTYTVWRREEGVWILYFNIQCPSLPRFRLYIYQ